MTRVVAYVDGHNLYSGLTDYLRRDPGAFEHNKLDLRRLIERHGLQSGETLEGVRWFSGIAEENWRDPVQAAAVRRHVWYREQLERSGVDTRRSAFRKTHRRCPHCGKRWKVAQEKESDQRAVLEVLEDALYGRMDRALIVSSDSDFVPVLYSLARFRDRMRPVDAAVLAPIGREGVGKALQERCRSLFGTSTRYMREKQIAECLLDTPLEFRGP